MKKFNLAFLMICLSSSAFAQTYNCGVLRDSSGQPNDGGPSYQVVTNSDGATLVATSYDTGRVRRTSVEMDMTFHGVDSVTYGVDGLSFTWMNGRAFLSNGDLSSSCSVQE